MSFHGDKRLLKALQRKHTDLTMKETLPDAAQQFARLERKVSKLEKRVRTIEAQSQKVYATSMQTERMLAAHINCSGGSQSGSGDSSEY